MADKAYFQAYYAKHKERIKARVAEYRKNHPEKAREAVRKWFADPANAERIKAHNTEYYQQNAETIKQRSQEWYWKNGVTPEAKQKTAERTKKWAEKNRHKRCASAGKRRAAKMRRTPMWLSDDHHWLIDQAYELAALRSRVTGFLWHVDHIVPLQGETVSGLHVPWNLQVLEAKANIAKRNRLI